MSGGDTVTVPELLSRARHCLQQGHLVEAEAMCRTLLECAPHHAEAHFQLGLTLSTQGRREEAIPCYQQALAIRPDYAEACYRLGNALAHLCRFDAAISSYEQALALKPDYALAHDTLLFAMLYRSGGSTQQICAAHSRYAEQCERPLMSLWLRHANTRDPGRRLKVGYISPDFREHPVACFIAPILEGHDASQIESCAYYNHTWQDATTDRIRAATDHWIPCSTMSDEQLADRIRADGIDILVDLAGHTVGNRLLVFARKPAPVQVSYLGYPATTGLQAMDWRLVTAATDPEGAEQWHSERLYRLPRSLWCYRPPETGEASGETPARSAGYITFGSMNNIAKVSDAAVAVWSEILKRVPGSRLVLTNVAQATADEVRARFARHGVAAERLRIEARLEMPAYRSLLKGVDIALDPFPYNGTTTTCDVLWTGIPVVSLAGEASVSRSGYALLKSVGLEGLVAHDEREYIAIAAALAEDLNRLDKLRSGMRSRLEASPLRDEAGCTRDIEAAYRHMWRQWCMGMDR